MRATASQGQRSTAPWPPGGAITVPYTLKVIENKPVEAAEEVNQFFLNEC